MNEAPACRPPPVSLSTRLIAGALGWIVVILALGGWGLSASFRDAVEEEFGHRLEALLQAMIADTAVAADGTVRVVRPLGDARFDRVFSGWYWQIADPAGHLTRSRSLWDSTLPGSTDGKTAAVRRIDGPRGERLLAVERDVTFPDAPAAVHVVVAGDLDEVSAGVRRFNMLLAGALGLLGAGMAVAVLIQVGYGLRPLRALKADLDAVREGAQPRLGGRYPREIAPLAEAMNRVLDHDEVLIERARTHVGNLAHSLKTPLAVLQAEMQGTADPLVVMDQVRAMARLVEHNLGRASAVAGAGRALGTRVPVADIAAGLAKALTRIHAERGLAIEFDIPPDAAFRGQREDLEEMLGNLLDNACKWTRSRVRVSAAMSEGDLTVAVEDDGSGLSPEEAERAVHRGARLDQIAPGWGLGLAIVVDLAAVNGGSVTFARSTLGGLMVSVRLPGWTTARA